MPPAPQALDKKPLRRLGTRLLAGVVGFVFVMAAVLKALDMELFIRQIKTYGIVSGRPVLIFVAWAVIALELFLGVAMIVAYRPTIVLPTTVVLLLSFLGLTGWAWHSGAAQTCGCFGAWLERTPGQAALEDIVLVAATMWAWAGLGNLRAGQSRASWKKWTVLSASIAGLALPAILGFPVLSWSPPSSGAVENQLGRFATTGLGSVDLNTGTYIIVIMGTGCAHCQDAIPQINMLAETPGLPSVVGLCVDDKTDRLRFLEQFRPSFPLGQIPEDIFWQLLGDAEMPRMLLVRDGRIVQSWNEKIPAAEAVRTASLLEHSQ